MCTQTQDKVNYYGSVTFLLHSEFHWSNRHLSQKTIESYVRKSWDKVPYSLLPSHHVFIAVSIFATMMLAAAGSYRHHHHSVPNPSTKTSSKGPRQYCLPLVWADSTGGASSIVLTHLVHFCLFYFSAAPPLHLFCPACVDHWLVPSPSHLSYPSSLLSQHNHCILLALPVLVRHHRPLVLALLTLSLYPYRPHCHCRHNTPIFLPLLPTYIPCI